MPLKSRQIRRLIKKKRNKDLSEGDPLRHVLVCRSKIHVFDTEAEARVELDRLIRESGFSPLTRPFLCDHCARYHIGRPRR